MMPLKLHTHSGDLELTEDTRAERHGNRLRRGLSVKTYRTLALLQKLGMAHEGGL